MAPTCLLLSTNEYLVYDADKAAIISMYRSTANFWVDRKEDRALFNDELGFLEDDQWDFNEAEKRDPTEEEFDILGVILSHHPEIKYLVESVYKVCGEKTGLEEVKAPSGLQKVVLDFFESWIRDPEKAKEGKKLKEQTLKDWKNVKQLEKVVQRDKPLRDFLMISLDEGQIGPGQLAVLDELIRRDPSWLKEIDLPDIDAETKNKETVSDEMIRKVKLMYKKTPLLSVQLKIFKSLLDEEDLILESTELSNVLNELLKSQINNLEVEIDVKGEPDEGFKRKVDITGTYGDILQIAKQFKIKTTDLLEDII